MPEILKKVMEQLPAQASPTMSSGAPPSGDGEGKTEWIEHWRQRIPNSPPSDKYDYDAAYAAKAAPTQGPDGKFRWPDQFKKTIPTTKGVSVDAITKTADEVSNQ